jgi:transposase InsO family protein/transposase-like protein
VYSREKRLKAIKLYLKYDKSEATVIRELGYPTRKLVVQWYKQYLAEQETGVVRDRYRRGPKYTPEQQQAAVSHYLEHGRNLSRTVRVLGYPSRCVLLQWCDQLAPGRRRGKASVVQFTAEQKREAVVALCSRKGSAQTIATEVGSSRYSLYKWKHDLLGKEEIYAMPDKNNRDLTNDRDQLLVEIEALQRKNRRLKLENDILEGTVALIKKDMGADPARLTNREKAKLVDALKGVHPVSELLDSLGIAKSSYYYQIGVLTASDKYEGIRARIVELFHENGCCYGYRRIWVLLVREGRRISEKVVRTLMTVSGLIVGPKKKTKYRSYQGEISPSPENLLQRNFKADLPNLKWLTDITEFQIPAGKAYLSPIVDCFDGLLVSWAIATHPDAELVNGMLDLAMTTLDEDSHPILHSDRGCHYQWPGWLERTNRAGLIRSMSRKGCSPDNAACEGLFGRIKNEMFYNRSWHGVCIEEFIDILDRYLHWYNESRIKLSLGGLSPVEHRLSLGYAR